jgi:hypothetical protein
MSQIQYGDRQTGSTCISGSTLDSSEIPKATPMFPWTIGAMACTSMSYMFPAYVEFNMAAAKPEVVTTMRRYVIEMQF